MEHLSNDHALSQLVLEQELVVVWKKASPFEFEGMSMKTEIMWSEFFNGGEATAEVLAPEKRNNSKESGCESHSLGSE